ncbi:zinc finger and SCAN domain-containing protein 21-like [Sapajus apella]|uniref:Zinc finger and SCAN domain-containing protein 21-like n=1 Tax=Sapajus apella TaxID=9515 RepID=A0A6J3JFH1_SAPAP|nr:zinc finger and SCAN domain-containing protein 21-like [Sapajus apella]
MEIQCITKGALSLVQGHRAGGRQSWNLLQSLSAVGQLREELRDRGTEAAGAGAPRDGQSRDLTPWDPRRGTLFSHRPSECRPSLRPLRSLGHAGQARHPGGPMEVTMPVKQEAEGLAPGRQGDRFRRFRRFRLGDAPRPHYTPGLLCALCRDWLRLEVCAEEQKLELRVLEQFLSALPADTQAWVCSRQPQRGKEAVALLEEL